MRRSLKASALALMLVMPVAPAQAQDGRTVFQARCASCHALLPGAPKGPGPNLAGLTGRRVADDPDFDYSDALNTARKAGDVWDRDRLMAFLADPEDMYPGVWMGANGLRSAADRDAVAGFLLPPFSGSGKSGDR